MSIESRERLSIVETKSWVYIHVLWACAVSQWLGISVAALGTYMTGNGIWLLFLIHVLGCSPSLTMRYAMPYLEPK